MKLEFYDKFVGKLFKYSHTQKSLFSITEQKITSEFIVYLSQSSISKILSNKAVGEIVNVHMRINKFRSNGKVIIITYS